jgi:hypothetical protein
MCFSLGATVAMAGIGAAATASPQEAPAIWCLFSIGIVLIALSPWIRRRFEAGQGWPRKASGQAS